MKTHITSVLPAIGENGPIDGMFVYHMTCPPGYGQYRNGGNFLAIEAANQEEAIAKGNAQMAEEFHRFQASRAS